MNKEGILRSKKIITFSLLVTFAFMLFILLSNKNEKEESDIINFEPTTIYYNSFESERDASWLIKNKSAKLVNNCAPGCGKKSLLLTGACIQPAARFEIPVNRINAFL